MRISVLLMIVALFGCVRRTPTPHDGSCRGRATAEYHDCASISAERRMIRIAFAGGDPVYIQQHELAFERDISACRFSYQMAMDGCRYERMAPPSYPAPTSPRGRGFTEQCSADTDCEGYLVCEDGLCAVPK